MAISRAKNDTLGTNEILPETTKEIAFSGNSDIVIPTGALVVSDPIDFPMKNAQETLTTDIYLERGQSGGITGHPSSRTTSWFALGDWVGEKSLPEAGATNLDHWYSPSILSPINILILGPGT